MRNPAFACLTAVSLLASGCSGGDGGGETPAPSITITTGSLPAASTGVAYTATLTASGGSTPYAWSVVAGSLPPGLTLGASTGAISGLPTTAGAASFTVQVQDASSPTLRATKALGITVSHGSILALSTTSLPSGTLGAAYGAAVAASGGTPPYAWSVTTGTLPAGLALSATTGIIAGVPTAAGRAEFTVQVTDTSLPPQAASRALSIDVSTSASLAMLTPNLPAGTTGAAYTFTLAADGGTAPHAWSLVAGSLPPGLVLTPSTGLIAGTPISAGTWSFTLRVSDSSSPAQQDQRSLGIVVNHPSAPRIPTMNLPEGTTGAAYTFPLSVHGGRTPYAWSIDSGNLPPGLTLAPATGVVSGTPLSAGDSWATVRVTDGSAPAQSATRQLAFRIVHPSALRLPIANAPDGVTGQAYAFPVPVEGGKPPYAWSIASGNLPPGLTIGASSGAITGTPLAAGEAYATVRVSDASSPAQQLTRQLTISVGYPTTLRLPLAQLPVAVVGVPYSVTLPVTGGAPPYAWSLDSGLLPAGLTLAPATGRLSGTPTAAGSAGAFFRVIDASSPPQTATESVALTVEASAPEMEITTLSLPAGALGAPYTASLQASGGQAPFTWSVWSNTLPSGLLLDAATGAITGTPTAWGVFAFGFSVTDSASPAHWASGWLDIHVSGSRLVVTTPYLPPGTTGQAYAQTLALSGGTPPFTWTVVQGGFGYGALPRGLTLDSASGAITGTPGEWGDFPVGFSISDSSTPQNYETIYLDLPVAPATRPVITTAELPAATAGQSYDAAVVRTGGTAPFTWTLVQGGFGYGSLPPGLLLDAATGAITGAATEWGSFPIWVQLTDTSSPALYATATLDVEVSTASRPAITSPHLPIGTVGTPYAATLAREGGQAPFTWSVLWGTLPPGLVLDAATGALSGTPTLAGTWDFAVSLQDSSSPAQWAQAQLGVLVR